MTGKKPKLISFWEGVYADRALLSPSTAELIRQTLEALRLYYENLGVVE